MNERMWGKSVALAAAAMVALSITHAAANDSEVPGGAGLAGSASKVYQSGHGVSLGGYGETVYENYSGELENGDPSGRVDRWDFLRSVLYVGYKFNDEFLLNTEIEVEHGSTGSGGEVSLEFGYIDWLLAPQANLRGGMVLVPMGIINETHEPTTFSGAKRPTVEQRIIPTTWRENGFGVYGDLGPVQYRTYVMTGLDAANFSAGGIRSGRQKGAQAKAQSFAWTGRLEHTTTPGINLGASAYVGRAGQDLLEPEAMEPDDRLEVSVEMLEAHGAWRHRGIQARLLGVVSWIGNTEDLNAALELESAAGVGERQWGGYAEVGYDVLTETSINASLIPFVRFERLDTQDQVASGFASNPANDQTIWTFGASAHPIPQVTLKVDYQAISNKAETGVDQFNVGLGYAF